MEQWVKHLDGFSCHVLIYNVCELHIYAHGVCMGIGILLLINQVSLTASRRNCNLRKGLHSPVTGSLSHNMFHYIPHLHFCVNNVKEYQIKYTCFLQLKMNRYLFFLFKVINGREFAKDSVVRKYNVIPDLSIYPVKAPRVFTVARSI